MPSWTWAAAACRGTSHERSRTRGQDAKTCFVHSQPAGDILIAIAADGAGSAELGGQGAHLACRAISVEARKYFRAHADMPDDEEICSWIDSARDQAFRIADRRGKHPRDFASTLICAVSNAKETLIAHIGDGCVVMKDKANNWLAPLWPDHGEYASTTSFLTDEQAFQLRCYRHVGPITSLVLFTDGIERLALDFLNKKPFSKFFEGIYKPLAESSAIGRDRALCKGLTEFLNSAHVNARTDDDKTLVVAVHR